MSALPIHTSGSPPLANHEDPGVLEESAEDAAHPDVLRQPGHAGRSAQMPRTQMSTGTPACDAR